MPLRLQLPAPTQGSRPAGILILIATASQASKAAVLTAATMICFAANSLLCRLALGPGLIDPASLTTLRVLAAVVILALVVWQRYGHLPSFAYARVRSVAALLVYLICFSFAYVRLTAGTGGLCSAFRPCHRRDRRCDLAGRAGHAPTAARLPAMLSGIALVLAQRSKR